MAELLAKEPAENFKPARAVTRSEEFERIKALPRRDWEARDQSHVETFFMQHLRAPGGTQRLRPVQIAALWEMHHQKGLFMQVRTGGGKTIVSLLGFIVLNSVRPLLIVPAALKEKTLRDMNRYRKDWLVPAYVRILSYELIGRPQSASILEDYQPDVVIMDECFAGETLVSTDVGDVPIRDVVEKGVGMYALSRDPVVDAALLWRKIVRRIKIDRKRQLVRVIHERGEFVCTAEHKVYVDGVNPREAVALQSGDKLCTVRAYGDGAEERSEYCEVLQSGVLRSREGGQTASRERLHARATEAETSASRVVRVEVLERGGAIGSTAGDRNNPFVYDLEIEGTHTYFADGVLVSNCHRAKSATAACTKRIKEYLHKHTDTRVVAMSGTIAKRSIKDYAHIADWCLRERAPVPRDFRALVEWSSALDDEKSFVTEDGERAFDDQAQSLEPGVLLELCSPAELAEPDRLRGVRKAYRRRLTDSPGVIATQESALGVALQINPLIIKDPAVTAAAALMRQTWERPDGAEFFDTLEMWRHLRTLAVGFYHRWNPAPPDEWRAARRDWAATVREILRTNRRGLHSEVPVREAVQAGEYGQDELAILERWQQWAPQYDPEKNKEAVWISRGPLDAAAAWAAKNPGLIWVSYPEFGNMLSAITKMPFYWNKGLDAKGRFIEDHPHKTPMIASIHANSAGLNLQYGWSSMLYTSFPTTGLAAEQSISRVHREGQPADEVVIDVMAALPENLVDFDQACADARRATDMEGQEQRLCYADITIPPAHERGALWQ